jgi:hypothetical protein
MGFFSTISYSMKKNKIMRKYSLELGKERPITVESLLNNNSRKTESDMFDYCMEDPHLGLILKKYGVTKNKLDGLYSALIYNGLGQWVKGHYVAVSVLFFTHTLEYALKNYTTTGIDYQVAYNLLDYFEKGKVGNV